MKATSEVRCATTEEIDQAISTIMAAFITDPLMRFLYPSPHEYLCAMPDFAYAICGQSFDHDCAYVDSNFHGAALWLPPNVEPNGDEVLKLLVDWVPPDRIEDLMGVFERMDKWHPEQPVWYLAMIGVEPVERSRGLGGALLAHSLQRCDEEGLPAYLESTNPRNVPLYERHGFEVMGEINVGQAPVVTPMYRRALVRSICLPAPICEALLPALEWFTFSGVASMVC